MAATRIAGPEEIDALVEWRMEVLREVFRIPEGEDTSGLEEANRRYYEDALAQGLHVAVFAEEDGEIVGCGGLCIYREMPSPENPSGLCGQLMNIYVRSPYRGRGVGTSVVSRLTEEASARGIGKLVLEATPLGRGVYERLGFRPLDGSMARFGGRG